MHWVALKSDLDLQQILFWTLIQKEKLFCLQFQRFERNFENQRMKEQKMLLNVNIIDTQINVETLELPL